MASPTSKRLRVLGLVPYPPERAPSQRFRIEQWIPHLKGIDFELAPLYTPEVHQVMFTPGHTRQKISNLLKATLRRVGHVRSAKQFDAVFLHREALVFGPTLLEHSLARRAPFVYDFDDAIWMPSENPSNPLAVWLKFQSKTGKIISLARAVSAGNAYLAQWASQFNPNVHVVPTTIDTEGTYHRTKVHASNSRPIVGWTGSQSTLKYLRELVPMLEKVHREVPFVLRVVCNAPAEALGALQIDWCVWNANREVDDIFGMDVGLMPQPDDQWAKGKCGLKALQYMSMGIPAVGGRSGVLPDIIEHGVNGYLAANEGEWREGVLALVRDVAHRQALGTAAQATVKNRYSASVAGALLSKILRDVAARK